MRGVEQLQELSVVNENKIVLLIMDGLGGLPHPRTGLTELETARTPNLDRLASEGMCGLHEPAGAGITPGSGPGHLGLFGYDPFKYLIGRGALEAVGIDFPLKPGDLAARGNFCSVDKNGNITDRRAGRIPTEKCAELCALLSGINLPGIKLFVQPVKDHRFLVVFRSHGLPPNLEDTDPQKLGVPALDPKALDKPSAESARVVESFVKQARSRLAGQHPANMILLRGFSSLPHVPALGEICGLRTAAVAAYPMYKGLARLLGMTVFNSGPDFNVEMKVLKEHYGAFDFFFVHFKKTDAAGEDGDFERKVAAIEEFDAGIPKVVSLQPAVLAVTGDHSTPAALKSHSWHSVPFLLSSRWCRPSHIIKFGESDCARGNLGIFPAVSIMPMLMAHAQRLNKYGA